MANGNAKKRVLIVDDHPIVRHGICQLIHHQKDLAVCGEAGDDREALELVARNRPHVVLVDLTLKRANGIELIRELHARYPEIPMLVLSIHEESLYADRVLRAGARGYLMKQEATVRVLQAIRQVLAGEIYLSDAMRSRLFGDVAGQKGEFLVSPISRLSNRQLQVFQLIGRGLGTRDIARELGLSVKTIETHRANIILKLKLKDSREMMQHAVLWAQRSHPA